MDLSIANSTAALKRRLPGLRRMAKVHHPVGRRFRIIGLAALVGVLSGLAAAILHAGLQYGVEHVIGRVVELGSADVFQFRIELLLLPAFGGLLLSSTCAAAAASFSDDGGSDVVLAASARRISV